MCSSAGKNVGSEPDQEQPQSASKCRAGSVFNGGNGDCPLTGFGDTEVKGNSLSK